MNKTKGPGVTMASKTDVGDIAPTYLEEMMRCKLNEMVHVMNDLTWRLDIVERKFFVREHDVGRY